MDNETRGLLRSLELQNEAKSQDLSIAYQRIADLEQQVSDLSGPSAGSIDFTTETQIQFIQRIAESRTKFAKEAQTIIDAINVVEEIPVDPNA
jgi:beta-lactamase class D